MDFNLEDSLNTYGFKSSEDYEACIKDISDKLHKINNYDWQDIIDKYDLSVSADSLRKSQSIPMGGVFMSEYFKQKGSPDWDEKLREIRKEKQKLYDERTAYNKTNRNYARIETDLSYLKSLIEAQGYRSFEPIVHNKTDNDLLVVLSDLHYGMKASNRFGEYNSCVAKTYANNYLAEILKIKETHNSENCYLVLLGDLISGNIHQTVQLENRENVIEQVQGVSELIANFAHELSKHFSKVYINGIAGNHSRLSFKDSVLRDERLDNLIPWYLKAKLANVQNIEFQDHLNYDATIGNVIIRDREYLIVHGDFDSFNETTVSRLSMMVGNIPEAIVMGHLHHCAYEEINGVKLIRSGSFNGGCDDYTVSKRLSGTPRQAVCVIDKNGVQAFYPVNLTI